MSQPYVTAAAFGGADSVSAFFQPTAKRPRFDVASGAAGGGSTGAGSNTGTTTSNGATAANGGAGGAGTNPYFGDILDPSSFFDDAFPLSNSNGGGQGGGHGHGHALRTLSNPWLLSQMRRASLSAFMDTAAMSNMMLPGSSSTNNFNNNSRRASNGGHSLIVPTLDGPTDRDEIFKTGDNVIFGAATGASSNNAMNNNNNNIGGGGPESSNINDYNNHNNIWGLDDHHSKDPNANIQTLASLQFQYEQLQLQQQQNQLQQQLNQQQIYAAANSTNGTNSSNKRSATSAHLDAHKPFQQYITSHDGSHSVAPAPATGAASQTNSSGPATTTTTNTIVSPSSSISSSLNNGQSNVQGGGVSAIDVGVAGGDAAALNVRFRSHQAENWTEKYETLLDYRLKNGHCLVPNQYAENPPLAEWVKRQRYQYKLKQQGKHSSMSDDRIAALEKLGFVWNSHDEVWEERLNELKQYKSIFGDTNVPSNYQPNPKLAIWVKRQRRQRKFLLEGKKSTMTTYRCQRLEEIGFTWSGRKPKKAAKTETWEKKNAM